MKYIIKRKNHIIAQIRPEGQLQTSIMGEELVTMAFSLGQYIRFQTGDSVEVYGNIFYLASEPQVEKISTREFRYSLEFQGVKYELSKVQYLFPDAQNVLNLSEFHIMGTARQMLDLLVQNANRIGAGWSLGNIDTTETKQLHFSAENCLSVLSKIAQEFHLEYWVDANKSIHLTERKAVSGYSFEYGKSKGLVSLTREKQQGSNIVTRLYAFGSEKNIAGSYRNGQKQLRMAVPYLEKNTDIYGIIEASQTFDVYPHRIGKVTAINPNNPLQFTDNQLDFDLNEKDFNGTKYLINGVPLKVTFNTGQLAGYTFEVKEFGYHSATKTFTLLKNTDEKNIEVPSENLRPAVGDSYVLTDLIMPQKYIANAEAELQRKAQAYLNENSRERVVYRLATDPLYFKEQNVNLQLGSTILVKDADFNLEENLRIIRLVKDLQNPYKVQVEVAERAEIAHIVREYLQEEKAKTALVQADKFNAEIAKKAYRFGREIHENIFDGEGYFDTEKIKPLSIDTKHISVGSRMQQFALPDVMISVENATTIKNTRGKIVHFSLEENLREWHIPANTQRGISAGFHYIYIKAQRNGNNASVWVSSEKIAVESDPNFYHFEAGYLGSVEGSNRRIRLSHGFTQISPHEITTGKIAPPSGNHYIELLHDRINIVGDVTFSAQNRQEITQMAQNEVNTSVQNLQIGNRNHVLKSKITMSTVSVLAGGTKKVVNDPLFGEVIQYDRPNGGGDFQFQFSVANRPYLNNKNLIYMVIAKPIGTGTNTFNFGLWRNTFNSLHQNSNKKELGGGWFCYWTKVKVPDVGQSGAIGISSVRGSWLFYAVGIFETTNYVDWSPAPEDITAQITTSEASLKAYADAQDLLQKTLIQAHADNQISEAEQRQINLAEAKLQEAKTHATNAVNSLQVGGRNYFVLSNIEEGGHRHPPIGTKPSEIKGANSIRLRTKNIIKNEDYILSWDKNYDVVIYVFDENEGFLHETFWTLKSPFKIPTEWKNLAFLFRKKDNSRILVSDFYKGKFKLEKGNKATDWSPAPEDTDQKIADTKAEMQEAINRAKAILEAEQNNIKATTDLLSQKMDFVGSTKINGNTVATGVLALGNSVGANAFISGVGLSPTEERIAIGASSFEQRSQAPFRVLANGTLHATNAHLSGTINAQSGTIGGFSIAYNKLFQKKEVNGHRSWAKLTKNITEIQNERIIFRKEVYSDDNVKNDEPPYTVKETIIDSDEFSINFTKNGIKKKVFSIDIDTSINTNPVSLFIQDKRGLTGTVGLGTGWNMEVTNGIITNVYRV